MRLWKAHGNLWQMYCRLMRPFRYMASMMVQSEAEMALQKFVSDLKVYVTHMAAFQMTLSRAQTKSGRLTSTTFKIGAESNSLLVATHLLD